MTKLQTDEILDVKEKIKQLENHKKQLIQQNKVLERKARTRRLIERGAILETIIKGAEHMTNEEIKEVLEVAFSVSKVGKIESISTVMKE